MDHSGGDTYRTIGTDAECVMRERGSRFITYAYHVESEDQIKERLDALRKRYFDATHHCYAWRLGPDGERERANDDGEPSGSAGKPILGQMYSRQVTDALIVVVRYFGGTKLGVPGLIAAYKDSAAIVLDQAEIVEKTVGVTVRIVFSYLSMNDVMRVVKEIAPEVVSQEFDNVCRMELSVRKSRSDELIGRLIKAGAQIDEK